MIISYLKVVNLKKKNQRSFGNYTFHPVKSPHFRIDRISRLSQILSFIYQ